MNISRKLSGAIRAHRPVFVAALVVVSLASWAAVATSAWFLREVVTGLPAREDLRDIGVMAQATTLLDTNGKPAFTIFKEQRIEVPLDRISPHLIRAIIAIEDQRFYDHGGLDIVRVIGAAVNNFREGRAVQGGSTLTQQLARQGFLSTEKTYQRKLKEAIVAARLETEFDKQQILELYLNKVYFGDGLYGVEAASLGYFGKHAAEVDVAEAALLAGLVKSPSTYAPTVDLDRAVARRNVVLQVMRQSGAIDAQTFANASKAPVVLNDTLRKEEPYGQYFKEEVRKQLVERFGWERVYQGGLRVHTTLDLSLQKVAEAEVRRGLDEIEKRTLGRRGDDPATTEPLQGALVAMDVRTGEVRALVGGRDFEESRFNRVTQARRQPGSAFKPFVYAAALERGFSPATLLTDLDDPVNTPQGDWVPEDDHSHGSSMTMRTALRTSSNRAAVRMLQDVGIPPTVQFAERFGVGSVPHVPSLALGSGEVTLISMTAAYAAFANAGMVPTPTLIRRVETTGGEVLFDGATAPHRAVSEATAFLMSSMLADVVDAGTAAGVRSVGFRLPASGKTGTTNDYHDAWFVGYTPRLVTGVWVGYDMPRTIMRDGYAGRLAVPIWGRFMKAATSEDKPERFKAPSTITTATICRLSGRRATDACRYVDSYDSDGNLSIVSAAYTEYFVRGTEPTGYCHLHDRYDDDTAARTVATNGTIVRGDDDVREESSRAGERDGERAAADPGEGRQPSAAAAQPGARPEPATPAQRRGFWSRLFRRGGEAKPDSEGPPREEAPAR